MTQQDTRRDFLKKAGIASAGVTAASWAAPSILTASARAAGTCLVSNPLTQILDGGNVWSYAFWASSISASNNDPITSWTNQGTVGGAATQNNANLNPGALPPTYQASVAGINNQPAVQAQTAAGEGKSRLATGANIVNGPLTLVVVGSLVPVGAGGNARDFLVDGVAGSANRLGLFNNETLTPNRPAFVAQSAIVTATVGNNNDASPHLWEVNAVSSATSTMRRDGTAIASATGPSGVSTSGMSLFARSPSIAPGGGSGGYIAFAGLYQGTLTATERARLRDFATCVYGLTVAP